MRVVRLITVMIGFMLSLNLAFAANTTAAGSSAMPLDKVIAIVNSNVITQSQLNAAITDMKVAMQMSGQPVDLAELKKKALDQLIMQRLELDVAARNKITVSDAELLEVLNKIAAQNHMTLEQLKVAVVQQGISYNRFRAQIHDQLTIHSLEQRLFGGSVTVSDQEVKDFMKKAPNQPTENTQYYVDDLLIPVEESASPSQVAAAQKLAQSLLVKAQQGKSFAELASSAADSVNITHTDLGWRRVNDLPGIFAQEVAGMQVNTIKGLIRAPNGFHLIKLMSIRGKSEPLTEAQAKNILFQQKIQGEVENWQQQIRKSSYVKIVGDNAQ